MICTFIDAGVLIAAARGTGSGAEQALRILKDNNREFASSIFLKLEVLPKAIYNQRIIEVEFYQAYFDAVTHWATNIEQIIHAAYEESAQSGLGAMDALHIAAAVSVRAVEFVTYEKLEKSIYRTKSIKVVSIRPEQLG
ncbi:MAG: type II toxin-antitoxin system VapC family toxin [Nostoc sp. ChiSLP01]|nr:nucleic acid-binding protein [Nostoc sp. CmiSLP01]MDZ8284194.1 nucleic acid-binding protein [Nostoc sp. ChiSLP01]